MGRRKVALAKGCYYHVFNKSIAGFEIFRSRDECERALEIFRFYRTALPQYGFSHALRLGKIFDAEMHGSARVKVIAFCVMPTHFHLFLEQTAKNGISEYMLHVAHSYASYFNTKTQRRGPLWESRFKNVLVENDAHAMHLVRYIHLNPVSAGLVEEAEEWKFSSFHEYLHRPKGTPLCEFKSIMDMTPEAVRRFTRDQADYQRSLQSIKHYLFD